MSNDLMTAARRVLAEPSDETMTALALAVALADVARLTEECAELRAERGMLEHCVGELQRQVTERDGRIIAMGVGGAYVTAVAERTAA